MVNLEIGKYYFNYQLNREYVKILNQDFFSLKDTLRKLH